MLIQRKSFFIKVLLYFFALNIQSLVASLQPACDNDAICTCRADPTSFFERSTAFEKSVLNARDGCVCKTQEKKSNCSLRSTHIINGDLLQAVLDVIVFRYIKNGSTVAMQDFEQDLGSDLYLKVKFSTDPARVDCGICPYKLIFIYKNGSMYCRQNFRSSVRNSQVALLCQSGRLENLNAQTVDSNCFGSVQVFPFGVWVISQVKKYCNCSHDKTYRTTEVESSVDACDRFKELVKKCTIFAARCV